MYMGKYILLDFFKSILILVYIHNSQLLTFYFFLFISPLEDPGLPLQNNKNFLPGHLMIRHGLSLK